MLLCYYVAWPCDLDLWPFDLESVVYSVSHVRPTYQFLLSYDYRLLSYEYWISDHISVIWKSLRMRRVTWPLTGGKNSPHFWNPWPQIAYSSYNFYAATTTIKGSLYSSIPVLKRFSVAKKVQSKSVPEMAVFRKFKGPNIKYSHRDPKRHFLTRNDVIWRILRKYPSRGVGCSLIEEPKKRTYLSPQKHDKITYLGNTNPLTDRYKILFAGCRPGGNHACRFLWRSVKGFWCGEGSNFGLFHWLASSPLKHSRTTVRVCDIQHTGYRPKSVHCLI